MSRDSGVYDLGNLDMGASKRDETVVSRPAPRQGMRAVPRRPAGYRSAAVAPPAVDVCGSLSIFLPGAGQILRGEVALGSFFIVSLAFVGTLAWAVLGSLERLESTLALLGYPSSVAAWILCALFGIAGALHVTCVVNAGSDAARVPHPAIAACASLVFPGWGQILNGDRLRAALFVCLVWLGAAAWIMVSPPAIHLLEVLGLYLPAWVDFLTSPAARYTLPAIVWTLAVYDAASRAAHRR
jgi:TM2 domain-containing membrane protein YozV